MTTTATTSSFIDRRSTLQAALFVRGYHYGVENTYRDELADYELRQWASEADSFQAGFDAQRAGVADDTPKTRCPHCMGLGRTPEAQYNWDGPIAPKTKDCYVCDGRGVQNYRRCPRPGCGADLENTGHHLECRNCSYKRERKTRRQLNTERDGLTKAQQRFVDRITAKLENSGRFPTVTVKATSYDSIWVSVDSHYRADKSASMVDDHYHIQVGPRGGVQSASHHSMVGSANQLPTGRAFWIHIG